MGPKAPSSSALSVEAEAMDRRMIDGESLGGWRSIDRLGNPAPSAQGARFSLK
jgi:hypothetical protein